MILLIMIMVCAVIGWGYMITDLVKWIRRALECKA
jgi:hypothetical protein